MKHARHSKAKKCRGFTLIELIVVIAILAILAAILLPVVSQYIEDAQDAVGAANARSVYTAAAAYVAKQVALGNKVHGELGLMAGNLLEDYLGSKIGGQYRVIVENNEVGLSTWFKEVAAKQYTFDPKTGRVTVEAADKTP